MKWRLYSVDGQTYHSGQNSWEAAPREGIVAVAWTRPGKPVHVELGTPYYLHRGDWIARCWEPGLYLRAMGVKFGRWATDELFTSAWRDALAHVGVHKDKLIEDDSGAMAAGIIVCQREGIKADLALQWRLYYDNKRIVQSSDASWDQAWLDAATDGVLCATYSYLRNGILTSVAMRRYTYYYWHGDELRNTDDLAEVLHDYPEFKYGEPCFTGKSYLAYGKAIAAALQDTLDDVPD